MKQALGGRLRRLSKANGMAVEEFAIIPWTSVAPNPGDPLTIAVTDTKNWSTLGALIPSFNNITVSVQTTMNLE
ncbi:MAG: hypothetical protein NTW80_10595 [Deltaproteobacteria bacterium]|nr:hypothetical protein [Deltaproteobacteria bacterium]